MKRALERYLGRTLTERVSMDDEGMLETVVFTRSVCQQLLRQLELRGHWQGGALFGEEMLGTLTVRLAAPLGPPSWSTQPLFPHLPYLIGWSDGVAEQHGASLDWCGNWIAAPDSRLPDERVSLSWLHLGGREGLFDETHPLLVIGIHEGRLCGQAYAWDEDGPVALRGPLEVPPSS